MSTAYINPQLSGWYEGHSGWSIERAPRVRSRQMITDGIEPEWISSAAQQLYELSCLETGWDGHHATSIRREILQFTIELLAGLLLPSTPAPSIVPLANGSLQFEWHERKMDIEVRVPEVNTAEVYVEDAANGDVFDFIQRVDFSRLETVIRKLSAR